MYVCAPNSLHNLAFVFYKSDLGLESLIYNNTDHTNS